MPHIRIKSISEDHVKELSKDLPKVLAQSMQTEEDNFTFELMPHQFFAKGQMAQSYPYVEVHWFERSIITKIESAKIITDKVRALTKAEDIAVVFVPILKSDYFENGKSF